jgi:hypothetical protein
LIIAYSPFVAMKWASPLALNVAACRTARRLFDLPSFYFGKSN